MAREIGNWEPCKNKLRVTNVGEHILIGAEGIHTLIHQKYCAFPCSLAYHLVFPRRYPYYALRLFDEEIGLITYLRYTLWIPLYPIGFMCEGGSFVYLLALLSIDPRTILLFHSLRQTDNSSNAATGEIPTFLY